MLVSYLIKPKRDELSDKSVLKSMAYGYFMAGIEGVKSLGIFKKHNLKVKRSTIFNCYHEFKRNEIDLMKGKRQKNAMTTKTE